MPYASGVLVVAGEIRAEKLIFDEDAPKNQRTVHTRWNQRPPRTATQDEAWRRRPKSLSGQTLDEHRHAGIQKDGRNPEREPPQVRRCPLAGEHHGGAADDNGDKEPAKKSSRVESHCCCGRHGVSLREQLS